MGARKQQQIIKTANYYMAEKKLTGEPARIDVVSILRSGDDTTVELIRNAFDAPF